MISLWPALSPINLSSLIPNIYYIQEISVLKSPSPKRITLPLWPFCLPKQFYLPGILFPFCLPKTCLITLGLSPIIKFSRKSFLVSELRVKSFLLGVFSHFLPIPLASLLGLAFFFFSHQLYGPLKHKDLEGWVHSTATCLIKNSILVHQHVLASPGLHVAGDSKQKLWK